MNLPSVIKIRRFQLGKNQEELSEAIGYGQSSISKVESGSAPCDAGKIGPWLDFLKLERDTTERREAALYMMPAGYADEMVSAVLDGAE